MNEETYKIELADLKLEAEWSGNAAYALSPDLDEKDKYGNTHIHTMYEVFFVSEGTLSVITHERKVECHNSIVVVSPRVSHFTTAKNANVCVMYFKMKKAEKDSDTKIFEEVAKKLNQDVTVLPINEEISLYTAKLNEDDGFLTEERRLHLMHLLFCGIFSLFAPMPKSLGAKRHYNNVKKIEGYLAGHYNEKILIGDLKKILYLSSKQISRIIRKEFNCTFSEMLTAHRLGVARMLLLRSDIDVDKIAAAVGYEYPANFYSNFKKAYAMTPTEYRKSAQNHSAEND